MARSSRRMKLPNGYGSIRYLGEGRRRPYAVCPPVREYTEEGRPVQGTPICYVDTWLAGMAVLSAWHAGKYEPGDEDALMAAPRGGSPESMAEAVLRSFERPAPRPLPPREGERPRGKTFSEVYGEFCEWKFGPNARRKYARATEDAARAAYGHCAALHGRELASIRHAELQECVDCCPGRSAVKEGVVNLIRQMYKYAVMYEIVDRDASAGLSAPPSDDEHGVPLSGGELVGLWRMRRDPTAQAALVMCLTGFRISAYGAMEVNLEEGYMRGGVKTASGKGRIVPIHHAVAPLVAERMRDGGIIPCSQDAFRRRFAKAMLLAGCGEHTPHDCRHTFSALLESAGVSESDRKRLMGHSLRGDITSGVYGHRTVEELREAVEMIRVPWE